MLLILKSLSWEVIVLPSFQGIQEDPVGRSGLEGSVWGHCLGDYIEDRWASDLPMGLLLKVPVLVIGD